MTLKQLEEKKAALKAELPALSAQLAALDAETDAEKVNALVATVNAKTAQINATEGQIKAMEALDLQTGTQPNQMPPVASEPIRKFASFGEQLKAIVNASNPSNPVVDERLLGIQAASGGSTAVGAEGGFLIQHEFSRDIFQKAFETGVFTSRCRTMEIGSGYNGIKLPYVVENSRAAGSRYGGVQIYRTKEAGTVNATKPQLNDLSIELEKMMGIAYATDELLEDATAMGSFYNPIFQEAIKFKADQEAFEGNGAGEMLGITRSDALVTVAKAASQAANTIVAENIAAMYSRLWAPSKANAAWFINPEAMRQLLLLNNNAGTLNYPIYMPPGGISGKPYGTIYGLPVIETEHNAALGTVGDIVLADMSQYLLITKGQTKYEQSMHVRFVFGEMAFRWTARNNGKPLWENALTPNKGTATVSPFVTLATRA